MPNKEGKPYACKDNTFQFGGILKEIIHEDTFEDCPGMVFQRWGLEGECPWPMRIIAVVALDKATSEREVLVGKPYLIQGALVIAGTERDTHLHPIILADIAIQRVDDPAALFEGLDRMDEATKERLAEWQAKHKGGV